jgi:hypothetical protein
MPDRQLDFRNQLQIRRSHHPRSGARVGVLRARDDNVVYGEDAMMEDGATLCAKEADSSE